jgi:hypothetical protein
MPTSGPWIAAALFVIGGAALWLAAEQRGRV